MAKGKSEKMAKEKKNTVAPKKPSKSDLKNPEATTPVLSSKMILEYGKKSKGKKAAKPPPPPKESSEESSEDSSENEVPIVQKPNGKPPPVKATVSSDSSSNSDSSSEDEKPKASQVKPKVSTTEETSSSSSEDETPAKPAPKPVLQTTATLPNTSGRVTANQPSSSSVESSDSDGESAPVVAKLAPKGSIAAPKGAVLASKAVASARKHSDSSDSSSDSESSDSDSLGENGQKSKLAAKVSPDKANANASESKSDEDSDDKEDVEMADATAPVPTGKRKAEDDGPAFVKKVKVIAPSGDADGEESKTLFVGQLSWNVDNDWLSSEFADAGDVISARVQMDRQSGRSRGFGYVEFATASAAQLALEKFQGKEIDGRAIKLDLSLPRQANTAPRAKQFGDGSSAPSSTLFVGNISWNTTEDILWEHFGQYGEVRSVRVPTDRESGKPKGFGYVEFSDIESAKKGFEGASGSEIDGRSIRLDYSQPRDSSSGGGGGFGGRGRGGDRGRGGRGFGGRGGGDRGRGGGRGGRGRGGGDRGRGGFGGGARTGGITSFSGKKTTFD